jgi:hypothetical protein
MVQMCGVRGVKLRGHLATGSLLFFEIESHLCGNGI